jgi:hypothetical protein
VNAGGGHEAIRIDQSAGAFPDEAVTMSGGSGADVLLGGAGAETLLGGAETTSSAVATATTGRCWATATTTSRGTRAATATSSAARAATTGWISTAAPPTRRSASPPPGRTCGSPATWPPSRWTSTGSRMSGFEPPAAPTRSWSTISPRHRRRGRRGRSHPGRRRRVTPSRTRSWPRAPQPRTASTSARQGAACSCLARRRRCRWWAATRPTTA